MVHGLAMTGSVIVIARLDATAFREADEAIPTSIGPQSKNLPDFG
jgi:hypothetical protein